MSFTSLSAADLSDLAGRFDRPELIGRGAVYILAFDSIRERSGRRWDLRHSTVREFAERQFEKYFPAEDAFVPLDDVNFLLVQSSETGFGAQTRALKLLRTVLEYFLGSSARSDISLCRVTRIGPGGVESEKVEFSDAQLDENAGIDWEHERGLALGCAPSNPDGPRGQVGPQLGSINPERRVGCNVLKGDRGYEALFLSEPIWGVRQRAVVSYLLRPLIFEHGADGPIEADLTKASIGDLVRLDLIAVAEAKRLFLEQGPEKRFALHVPIHHASLGTVTGRQLLLAALQSLQPLSSSCVVVVLKGLDVGAPQSRLIELTSLLHGRCRAVVAWASSMDPRVEHWRGTKLSGVAVDLSTTGNFLKSPTLGSMSEFTERVKDVAPALFAYSAANSSVLLAAWAAGFSHVSGDLVLKDRDTGFPTLRVEPSDIYQDRVSIKSRAELARL